MSVFLYQMMNINTEKQIKKLALRYQKKNTSYLASDSSDEDTYEDYLDILVNKQTKIQINNTREIIYENEEEED
ncbi:hypothetical protein BpHYR1_017507 [Brachionus plicatilis]|uniref:Uncharacterized protein n=1 Tax=Brachionus plicatilis TaxID=10195 RepID=A0A3M7RLK9_BRAPC|nr:hypothetical protein BpHYR1_017507 [Brachionus plicatilis]